MRLQIRRAWTDGFSELDVALGKPGQEAQMSRRVEGHLSGGPKGQGTGSLELVGSEQITKRLCSGQMLCWGPRVS